MNQGKLQITPASAIVPPGGIMQFTVTNSVGSPTWSIREGANAGTIYAIGRFLAPATIVGSSQTVHLEVIDSANPNQYAEATIQVTAATNADQTFTTLTANSATLVQGNTLSLSAQVTASGGIPGGTVTFLDGTNPLGAVALNGNGIAAFNTNNLSVGTHSLTASYQENGGYQSSASAPLTVTISALPLLPSLTSLTINPLFIISGQSAALTATLSGPAPATGATVTLNPSNPAAFPAPASIFIPAGQTSATSSPVVSGTVATVTQVVVNGNYNNDVTQQGAVEITPPVPHPLTIALTTSQASVNPGQSVTITAAFSGANAGAPTSQAHFSDTFNGTTTIIGNVAFSPGSTSGQYAASFYTSALAAGQHQFVVVYNGDSTYGAAVSNVAAVVAQQLQPSLVISNFSITPSSIVGGYPARGVVTLTGNAPAGGATIALNSNNPHYAQIPQTATVTAGYNNVAFFINTPYTSGAGGATITASYNGTQYGASFTVLPVAVGGVTFYPSTITAGQSVSFTVYLTGPAAAGTVVSLVSSNPAVLQVPASVTAATGAVSVTVTGTTSSVASQTNVSVNVTYNGSSGQGALTVVPAPAIALSDISFNPAQLAGGTSANAFVELTGGPAPPGGATVSLSSSSSSVSVPPTVTIPAGTWSVPFTVSTSAVSATTSANITASYAGVSLSASITLYPPQPFMQSISFSPSTLSGGSSTTGTVTLTSSVPQTSISGAAWIQLAPTGAYLSNVIIPSEVQVPVGSSSATFNVSASTTNFISPLTISASYNGTSTSAGLIVTPPGTPLAPASLTLMPPSVIGGSGRTGTFLLTGPAPAGGATVTVSADSPLVQTASAVAVPPGATSATIAIETVPVSDISTSTITVVINGISQSALLTVIPSSKPNPGNPAPFLTAPLAPLSQVPNGLAIPITVGGSAFVSGAQVLWNGSPLPTKFESRSQLQATIPAVDTSANATGLISVINPGVPKLTSNGLPVHLRYPAGSLSFNPSALTISGQATFPSTGDFNGDGRLDIAVAKSDVSGLSIFLGNGDGTFGPERVLTGPTPYCTAVGDLNGDGKPDIVGVTDNGLIFILLGNGDGTFSAGITTPVPNPGSAPYAVLGDFNRDGILDLVVTTTKGLSVFLGNGDGTLGQPSNFTLLNQTIKVVVADFDGDGLLDLAAADTNNQSIAIVHGNGDGTFSAPAEYSTNGYSGDLAVADFNGDGSPDIAVANAGGSDFSGSGVAVLMNNGNGTLSSPVDLAPGLPYATVAAEDINGDGILDLVATATAPSHSNQVFLGTGGGAFSTSPISLGTAVDSQGTTIADFNGDGAPDILLIPYNAPATLLIQAIAPIIRATPSSLSFTVPQGAAASAPVSFTINNTGGGGSASWSASSSQPWLQLSQSAGSTPSIVQATANTAGLNAGSYSGVITVTVTGASNTPLAIPVSLTVQSAPVVISSIAVTPSILPGGGTVAGTITLTGPAPAGGYTVTISSSSSLVQVPSSITIAAGQASGTFNATTSTVTVSTGVSITVTAGEASASAAFTLNPIMMSSAAYRGSDSTTQGTWTGAYGADGFLIAKGTINPPAYATVSLTGDSTYTWAASSTDPRALQTASGASTRIASTDYSGASFTISVNLTDGNPHRVALYLLDWDSTSRAETISILDANTNTVLDTRSYSGFHAGVYASWNVQGHVLIQVAKTGGANAVVSGIFFDPPPSPASATYEGLDAATQGTWTGVYGSAGNIIPSDINDTPAFAIVGVTGDSLYTWAASTSDVRALQTSSGAATRIASTYYSAGFFTINVNLTDGNAHRIALYLVDWETTSRVETITVLDANSNAVLDTKTYSKFHSGVYAAWNVKGHVLIQVTKTGGANAVVSGIFFDPPQAPASATYIATDTATQGTWTGVYGSTGEIIANDVNNTPAFATVAFTGDSLYNWAASTSDVRALQTASGASTRIASTYYSSGAFTINVHLTDGNTHKVSLYLVDWETHSRAETIQIVDANSNAVLDTESYSGFESGQYAAWNVKGHVLIQVTKSGGANAVVSGIFFD